MGSAGAALADESRAGWTQMIPVLEEIRVPRQAGGRPRSRPGHERTINRLKHRLPRDGHRGCYPAMAPSAVKRLVRSLSTPG
ncbi:Mobile element protein [Streptomyces venezuelae]|nr:Mobile element protein [Streptomyces venezuelae]